MDASEVKVVRAGLDKPGPRMTGRWEYPFQIISVNLRSGTQVRSETYRHEDTARASAARRMNEAKEHYFYVLDFTTLPPVEYPA